MRYKNEKNKNKNKILSDMIFTVVYFKDITSSSKEDGCSICLCKFSEQSRIVKTQCCHYFCQSCLMDWFKIGVKCPLCRKNLRDIVSPIKLDGRPITINVYALTAAIMGRSL